MLDASGDTRIGTVRARAAERDALALRIRLGRVLSALSLRPSGVPPSAVVCVRRLSAPPLKAAGRGGFVGRASDWDRAVESSLARLVERAARPARGAVPADAEAVLFYDRAELLACLASDWLAGLAPARWWWRGILKGADAGRALVAAWLEAPEYVPSALEQLSRAGRAAAFVGALSEGEARALSLRLADAFALGELKSALTRSPTRGAGEEGGERDAFAHDEAGQRPEGTGTASGPAPPWRQFLHAAERAGLGREQESLLGVGLTIARAPSRARTSSFARAASAWRDNGAGAAEGVPGASRAGETAGDVARVDVDGRTSPASDASDGERREGLAAEPPAETRVRGAGEPPRTAQQQAGARGAGEAARVTGAGEVGRRTDGEGPDGDTGGAVSARRPRARGPAHAPPRQFAPPPSEARADRGEDAAPSSPTPAQAPPAAEPAPPAPWPLEARVKTKLGGLFYLVNLGLYLELYGDFTTPLQPGIALPLWDFVALLGRRLCAEDEAGEKDGDEDAAWALLARLAGRGEGEEPGRDFDAPDEWRVPPAWLAPFPEPCVWEWSARRGRLRVRHPQGFDVLDVRRRRGVSASRQLREETAAYAAASFKLRRASGAAGERGAASDERASAVRLERWVGRLAAYARARLGRALGQDAPGGAARLLLRHDATVRVTAAHVDVAFELARLPFEVRVSGLDRDPGWVPAAGRFIAFHFD